MVERTITISCSVLWTGICGSSSSSSSCSPSSLISCPSGPATESCEMACCQRKTDSASCNAALLRDVIAVRAHSYPRLISFVLPVLCGSQVTPGECCLEGLISFVLPVLCGSQVTPGECCSEGLISFVLPVLCDSQVTPGECCSEGLISFVLPVLCGSQVTPGECCLEGVPWTSRDPFTCRLHVVIKGRPEEACAPILALNVH